jgi:TonB family protein
MFAAWLTSETPQPAPVPRLLVELPSWPRVFFGNLRDVVLPRRLPRLDLQSAPAPFWPDVFVKRGLPWRRFFESGACHLIACALLIGFTRFFALQPQAVLRPTFDHSQVIYYQPAEYLPPLDTRSAQAERPRKADPEFSRQPIISVPPEADNRSQTIVAAPNVRLKHDVPLPNIVAWSDKMSDRLEKPQLAIPAVPLTPAAEITRIAPQVQSVVAPPPDAAHLTRRRDQPMLQTSVVAPPVDVRQAPAATFQAPQPAVIAPPPSVEIASNRPLGDLNIGRSSVIAPAPQLAVGEQRAIPGGRSSAVGLVPQVVAPAPSLAASGSSGEAFGSRGRVIALNLHPVVGAPPDPPPGNRRGTFAATPEGRPGASGSPGSSTGDTSAGTDGHANGRGKENGMGSKGKGTSDVPAGLYVGSVAAPSKASSVAGDPAAGNAPSNTVNPNLTASVHPPRVTSAPASRMQPDSTAKLTEPERAVFGDRKFYSLTLNMPNLNSAGGSWIIRFAELNHDLHNHDSNNHFSNHDANAPAADLSQPAATRKVDPAYPLQLIRENVAGTVILYAVIHADGTVGNVRVLRGVDDRLDQFASQAVGQWQFRPATKNGEPVDVEATFQIPFRPPRTGTNF